MMNPIFSRRYKGGTRPNIMPTTAKRQNYMKSMGTTGNSSGSSSSSMSSGSGGVLSTASMGDSGDEASPVGVGVGESRSPEREDYPQLFTKSPSARNGSKAVNQRATSPGESASRLLAQQLLASKQNMLAQSSLTPYENRERAKLGGSKGGKGAKGGGGGHPEERHKLMKGSLMRQSFSTESFSQALSTGGECSNGMSKSPTVHGIGGIGDMTLCDLEDLEDEVDHQKTEYSSSFGTPASSYYTPPVTVSHSRISRPNLNQRISKEPLDMRMWRELKQVVIGNGNFHDGWIGQGFVFDTKIPFGLIQKKGGPCGVLAVVQSLVIRNLLFGSPFSVSSPKERKAKLEEISAFLSEGGDDEGIDMDMGGISESIRKERVNCLVDAVAEIIWTCGEYQQQTGYGRNKSQQQERSSMIMFSDFRIQPEVICVKGRLELQHFLQNSIHRFDCIALVYSAVLTRGISGVKDDLDFENCSLIGQHGYCSQELINLLAIGRAISNTFDNEIELDGKILKGIPDRCDIGLLSLFEHYDSIKVGNFLKFPRFPVWMICSESHFSVMFSTEIGVCAGDGQDDGNIDTINDSFELFYYDGLSRQEKVIRLSIRLSAAKNNGAKQASLSSSASSRYISYKNTLSPPDNQFSKFTSSSSSLSANKDEDLVPPLEKCIRTKWPGAVVDWNDTEPIL